MEDGISGRHGMKKTGHRINPGQTQIFSIDINEITYSIRGAMFEVNWVLSPGIPEKTYENTRHTGIPEFSIACNKSFFDIHHCWSRNNLI